MGINTAAFLPLLYDSLLLVQNLDGHIADGIGPPPDQAVFQRGD